MRIIFTLTLLVAIIGCKSSSKTIYDDKTVNSRKLERLMESLSANRSDTSIQSQLRYAYELLEAEKKNQVDAYRYGNTLRDKEKLYNAYADLQEFYDKVKNNTAANDLLKPTSVGMELQQAKLGAVSAHYQAAVELLQQPNWKTAREAQALLRKADKWMPGYEDSRRLMKEAQDEAVIDAVILPVSADGFYYRNNNFIGSQGYIPQLHHQLARDLGGRFGQGNSYRVWAENGFNQFNETAIDWTVEPVWNYLRYNEPRSQTRQERRSKQIEAGRDTANRPIYKTVQATVFITEQIVEVNGTLELRINDVVNRERISWNTFNESHRVIQRYARYSGDAGALTNQDWQMINSPQYQQRLDEDYMEQVLLQKMYNDLLQHLRNRLNY